MKPRLHLSLLYCFAFTIASCAGGNRISVEDTTFLDRMVAHAEWEVKPPGGVVARGVRRNLAPGDSVSLGDLVIRLEDMRTAGSPEAPDTVAIVLRAGDVVVSRWVSEGAAFNWDDYHIAILAAHTDEGELGGGKAEIEVGLLADLPERIASSRLAGDAGMRLRIPHQVSMITLHHSGSEEPLRPDDDIPDKLRDLQSWSETDRNWWDVPYHFLIGLDGTIYEGRDYHFRGETNTRYDVDGHLLISVLGNYEIQEPTPGQIEAITEIMAWGVGTLGVPLDKIYGHSDLAATSCPGKYLRQYLEDGTFRSGIEAKVSSPRRSG